MYFDHDAYGPVGGRSHCTRMMNVAGKFETDAPIQYERDVKELNEPTLDSICNVALPMYPKIIMPGELVMDLEVVPKTNQVRLWSNFGTLPSH